MANMKVMRRAVERFGKVPVNFIARFIDSYSQVAATPEDCCIYENILTLKPPLRVGLTKAGYQSVGTWEVCEGLMIPEDLPPAVPPKYAAGFVGFLTGWLRIEGYRDIAVVVRDANDLTVRFWTQDDVDQIAYQYSESLVDITASSHMVQ